MRRREEDKDIFSVSSRGAIEGQYDVGLHLKEKPFSTVISL